MITPQVTTEEAFSFYNFFSKSVGARVYHWIDEEKMDRTEAADGILIRDDKNPNAKGLWEVARSFNMEKNNLLTLNQRIEKGLQWIVVVAPENLSVYPGWKSWVQKISAIPVRILLASADDESFVHFPYVFPTISYVEKHGTFVNYSGRVQEIYPAPVKMIEEAKTLQEILNLFAAHWGISYALSEGDLEGALKRLPPYKDFQYQAITPIKKIGRRRIYESYD